MMLIFSRNQFESQKIQLISLLILCSVRGQPKVLQAKSSVRLVQRTSCKILIKPENEK